MAIRSAGSCLASARPGRHLEHGSGREGVNSAGGGEADFQPLEFTDEAMDRLAQAIGCPVQAMTFEPYPS